MSEYVTIDTPLDDRDALKQALADIGIAFEENVEPVVHWHGRPNPGPCDFVVRRADLGGRAYNDLAWRQNAESGRFELVIDNLDQAHNSRVQELIQGVTQYHNAHKALREARRRGYAVGGRITRTRGGHLQVTVRRR